MGLGEDAVLPYRRLEDRTTDPSTPAAGSGIAFMKDGGLYIIDDAGTVTGPFAVSAGSLAFAGVWATKTSSYPSLTHNMDATLAFDAADVYDTDSFHDPASNNSRITIPLAFNGKKARFWGIVGFPSDTNGDRRVCLSKNGSLLMCVRQDAGDAVGDRQFIVPFPPIAVATNDYFELHAQHTAGHALSTNDQQFIMAIEPGS